MLTTEQLRDLKPGTCLRVTEVTGHSRWDGKLVWFTGIRKLQVAVLLDCLSLDGEHLLLFRHELEIVE